MRRIHFVPGSIVASITGKISDLIKDDAVRRRVYLRRVLPAVALALVGSALMLSPASADAYPFRNPGLSVSARVDDLLGRLTMDEKISMLHQYAPAIPRLGIPMFKTGTEALHGVAWSTDYNNKGNVVTANGTAFPQAVGLATVSYTHLRAHETGRNLVCRLLLEKK